MKFFVRQTARNLVRHKYKSILHVLIGVLTVLILEIYAGNMDSTRSQLTHLPEALEVTAVISSLNGSLRECVAIREDRVMGIRESEYVKDPAFTVRLKFGFGEFTVKTAKDAVTYLNHYGRGMNRLKGISGVEREGVVFLEGVDESVLETRQRVCLMEESLLEEKGLRLGTYQGNWMPPEIILPFDCVREAYHSQGLDFYADSGSFVVKDPFQLNALKEQMYEEVKFLPVITRAEFRYDGNALTIMDEAFIRSAETLSKNLALLQGMLPFLVAIVVFIGYLCSYLSLQSRREEYALLRSLGTAAALLLLHRLSVMEVLTKKD